MWRCISLSECLDLYRAACRGLSGSDWAWQHTLSLDDYEEWACVIWRLRFQKCQRTGTAKLFANCSLALGGISLSSACFPATPPKMRAALLSMMDLKTTLRGAMPAAASCFLPPTWEHGRLDRSYTPSLGTPSRSWFAGWTIPKSTRWSSVTAHYMATRPSLRKTLPGACRLRRRPEQPLAF